MKSATELRSLFENQLRPALQSLEGKRKKLMFKYIGFYSGIVISAAFILIFTKYSKFAFFGGLLGILTFVVLLMITKSKKATYRHEFKQSVVKTILQSINPEWNYKPNGRILGTDYRRSRLFNTSYDRYQGDDLVWGTIEKTDFQISELHTEYKTETTDSKGNSHTEWHTIFKGLFAHAEFNKEIEGKTIVLPDTTENLFGIFGDTLQSLSGRGKLIKLENVEFENMFVVYGSSQIESRYILTPTMMEAMLRIRKTYNGYVYFSFIGSRVYVALYNKKDMFEPRIFGSGVRFEDVLLMNEQFRTIQTIVRELNLNTRIWTKQ